MLFILSSSYGVLLESRSLPAFPTFMAGLQPQARYRSMAQCFLGIGRSCPFALMHSLSPGVFRPFIQYSPQNPQHLPSLIDSACRHLAPVKILCGQQELAPTLFIPGTRAGALTALASIPWESQAPTILSSLEGVPNVKIKIEQEKEAPGDLLASSINVSHTV